VLCAAVAIKSKAFYFFPIPSKTRQAIGWLERRKTCFSPDNLSALSASVAQVVRAVKQYLDTVLPDNHRVTCASVAQLGALKIK